MVWTNSRSTNNGWPSSSTAKASTAASTRFAFESHLMPRSRPLSTEQVASDVMMAMTASSTQISGLRIFRYSRPDVNWEAPNPREAATPNRVPTMANTSTTSPSQPRTRLPNRGSSTQRSETFRPLRCTV